jgi:hypothetical protein
VHGLCTVARRTAFIELSDVLRTTISATRQTLLGLGKFASADRKQNSGAYSGAIRLRGYRRAGGSNRAGGRNASSSRISPVAQNRHHLTEVATNPLSVTDTAKRVKSPAGGFRRGSSADHRTTFDEGLRVGG